MLIIDGHPAPGRLVGYLLDVYEGALGRDVAVTRIAVRDVAFDVVLRNGYGQAQALEPDLERVAGAIAACDHLVVGFPLWWGAEPAILKGLLDRVILPGFAFKYRSKSVFWDRLLVGRSADVIVTMDTPPWYLRMAYGNSVMTRWRKQVLGFCGFAPVRTFALGRTRQGGAATNLPRWTRTLERAAGSARGLKRGKKREASLSVTAQASGIAERQS